MVGEADSQAGAGEAVLPTELTVLAYNTFLLPWAVMPKTKKKARAQEFCRDHLHRFDVACLTEVWSDRVGRMTKLVKRAAVAEGGHSHRARGKRTVLSLTDGGLMTTSKHPIVRSAAHVYTKSAGMPDSLVANGCVYTMVRMNDGLAGAVNVHIFSTHMNSDTNLSKFGTEDGLNVAVRRKQFEELKQFMEDMVGDDNGIVLLCGDMNINARSPKGYAEYMDILTLLGLRELWEAQTPNEFPVTLGDTRVDTKGNDAPMETLLTQSGDFCTRQCLDYIWYRPDACGLVTPSRSRVEEFVAAEGAPYRQLSDHYGVSVTLRSTMLADNRGVWRSTLV